MAVGSIQYRGDRLSLLVARSDRGFPNAVPVVEEEAMATPRVNGKRWRTVFSQYEPTNLYTVIDCANFETATLDKGLAESFKGKLVRLQVTFSSSGFAFKDVHVEAVSAIIFPGPAVGEGATGTAHLVAVWTLVPTSFAAGYQGD